MEHVYDVKVSEDGELVRLIRSDEHGREVDHYDFSPETAALVGAALTSAAEHA
jgi:hypothetical protein